MSHHPVPPEEPTPDEPDAQPAGRRSAEITPGRRALWAVGGVVGGYMIVRGLYGIFNEDDEQP